MKFGEFTFILLVYHYFYMGTEKSNTCFIDILAPFQNTVINRFYLRISVGISLKNRQKLTSL